MNGQITINMSFRREHLQYVLLVRFFFESQYDTMPGKLFEASKASRSEVISVLSIQYPDHIFGTRNRNGLS